MPATQQFGTRRPRSKTAARGVRKGSMRQQLKPKTPRQLEAEERRLKRFDSDSESETEAPLPIPLKSVEPSVTAEDTVEHKEDSTEEADIQEDSEVEEAEAEEEEEEDEEDSDEDEKEVTEEEEEDSEDETTEQQNEDEALSDDEEVETTSKSESAAENKESVSGWADSIAKILGSSKPKNKKEIMLSRARKDYEVSQFSKTGSKPQRQPQGDLEIIPGSSTKETPESNSTEIIKDKSVVDDGVLSLKVQRKLELKQKKLERAWENLARLNMEKSEPEVERDLLKIATKGVVQLFNAIAMQQKTIKSKLKNTRQSEFQKDKILNQTKDIFDSSMSKSKSMGDSSTLSGEVKIKTEKTDDHFENSRKRRSNDTSAKDSRKKPSWNALQDDFMLDAKLKDWDQNSDSE